MNQQIGSWLYTISIWALPAIIAITFHEAAHGFAALRFGDDTALRLGRVTLNPLKHIDPMGTIFLPALLIFLRSPFLFGYAKPVPVNFRALRNPRRDMVWVAAAGPAMNIVLAAVAALEPAFGPARSNIHRPRSVLWKLARLRRRWGGMVLATAWRRMGMVPRMQRMNQ